MSEPRKGDTLIGQNGRVYTILAVGLDTVSVRAQIPPLCRRNIRLDSLEVIDPDDGLWAEMKESNG